MVAHIENVHTYSLSQSLHTHYGEAMRNMHFIEMI